MRYLSCRRNGVGDDKVMRTVSSMSFSGYDRLGTIVSAACILHCLATPVLVASLPVFAASMLNSEWLHIILAAATVPVASIAFRRGYRCHGSWLPFLIALPGLSTLWLTLLAGESHWLETALVSIGATLLITAHVLNHRFVCQCSKKCH